MVIDSPPRSASGGAIALPCSLIPHPALAPISSCVRVRAPIHMCPRVLCRKGFRPYRPAGRFMVNYTVLNLSEKLLNKSAQQLPRQEAAQPPRVHQKLLIV